MKEIINIYRKSKISVDAFITTLLSSLPKDYIDNADTILKNNEYIQLIYAVNDDFKQISPVICRKDRDERNLNSDKSHYFTKLNLDNNSNISKISLGLTPVYPDLSKLEIVN